MFSYVKLVTARESSGFTRSSFHRALIRGGLDRCRALVDRWESGRSEPSASEVATIARVLGVRIEDLFEPADGARS